MLNSIATIFPIVEKIYTYSIRSILFFQGLGWSEKRQLTFLGNFNLFMVIKFVVLPVTAAAIAKPYFATFFSDTKRKIKKEVLWLIPYNFADKKC